MNFDINNVLNGKFGKIEDGFVRFSMDGQMAIRTPSGYKTYNAKQGRLTNCNNFVFDIGQEAFFVIPTNHVKVGDIIIASGKPRYVLSTDDKEIKTVNYESGTIETILPERHMFMGNTYFYGKIVSMFGNLFSDKKAGANKMMQMMMLQSMFGKNDSSTNSGNMMMAMMMAQNGGFDSMFEGLFDSEDEVDDESKEE